MVQTPRSPAQPTQPPPCIPTKLTARACAKDLQLLGIHTPGQLVGCNPFEMYETLYVKTATRHDPCVIDVFMSVTRFMAGEAPRPWWDYTAERKQLLARS